MLTLLWSDVTALREENFGLPLSAYRAEKLSTMKAEKARILSLAAESLLLKGLGELCPDLSLPLDLVTERNGKPALRGGELCFNLSHSWPYVGCAFSDLPVGLDLQVITPFHPSLAKRCFTQSERTWLSAADHSDAAFTELWCRKESFLKATGEGIRLPMNSFSVSPEEEAPRYHGQCYPVRSFPLGKAWAALCLPAQVEWTELDIRLIKLP